MKDKSVVFLSHKCTEEIHGLLHKLSDELKANDCEPIVDPFGLGDRTAQRTQEEIKRATHFVMFSSNARLSRWLQVELAFAKTCVDREALRLLPVGLIPGIGSKYIGLQLDWSSSCETICARVTEAVKLECPNKTLATDYELSKILNGLGRKIETTSAKYDDRSLLHDAIEAYESSIQLDLSNAAAWANKSWCLFKLYEDARAERMIDIAKAIDPESSHVKDVAKRIAQKKRSIR